MASPALAVLAALASRRSLFFFRARAFLPDIALESGRFGCEECACRVRVVVRRGFRGKRYSGGSAGERKNKQLKLNLK